MDIVKEKGQIWRIPPHAKEENSAHLAPELSRRQITVGISFPLSEAEGIFHFSKPESRSPLLLV